MSDVDQPPKLLWEASMKEIDAPPACSLFPLATRMSELVQIRHDGELADKDDAMEMWNVVTAAAAGSIESPEYKLRFPDAVNISQAFIQLAELLLALIE